MKGRKEAVALLFTSARLVELKLSEAEIKPGGRFGPPKKGLLGKLGDASYGGICGAVARVGESVVAQARGLQHLSSHGVDELLREYPNLLLDYVQIGQIVFPNKWSWWSGGKIRVVLTDGSSREYSVPTDLLDAQEKLAASLTGMFGARFQQFQ